MIATHSSSTANCLFNLLRIMHAVAYLVYTACDYEGAWEQMVVDGVGAVDPCRLLRSEAMHSFILYIHAVHSYCTFIL